MIEKIMRAVKSSNKKRGRNITIGAAVGMLLSCSAVMGADSNYLWIKDDGGGIEFSKNNSGYWGENPYPENSWKDNTYINNITLSGENNGTDGSKIIGYGLRLSGDLEEIEFINNGGISGTGNSSAYGYGIYNSGDIKSLKNIGIITGVGTGYSSTYGYGIYNSGDIKLLKNIGIISGSGTGIGTGTVINGKLHKGKSNFSGEIGELPVSTDKTLEDDYKEIIKRKDMEKFEKLIIFILMINISILNPEIIVLSSDILKIEKSLLKRIIKKISERFGEENMPEIILDSNDIENGMKGALKLALQESDKDLKIIGK